MNVDSAPVCWASARPVALRFSASAPAKTSSHDDGHHQPDQHADEQLDETAAVLRSARHGGNRIAAAAPGQLLPITTVAP